MEEQTWVYRLATREDVPAMRAIYEPYVLHTSVTFEYTVPSEEEFTERMYHVQGRFPWLVCERSGQVVGYAYASPAFTRTAYSWDADMSVYLSEEVHHSGIGRTFYQLIENILRQQGYQVLYALVTEENFISQAFHEAMGYRVTAVLPATGFKFGRWHAINWYEKRLSPAVPPSDFPAKFDKAMLHRALVEVCGKDGCLSEEPSWI